MIARALSIVPDRENDHGPVPPPASTGAHTPPVGELPVATESLASREETAPAFWCVAAHGGAGATTLSHLWAPAGDAGQRWPAADEYTTCVVVCRSTMSGLDAAHSVILQAERTDELGCTLLGVVVVADAPGKVSKPLKQKLAVLEELATLWHIDYHPGLREHLPHDLATWEPTPEAVAVKKRRKIPPVTEEVPAQVADIGHAIFLAAYQAAKDTDTDKD